MNSIDQSIGIRPIHIRFTTNDNPMVENILTRDMIYIPPKDIERDTEITKTLSQQENPDKNVVSQSEDELSQYPFFTDTVRIPMATILKLSREDQIKLLFNKTLFKQKIGNKTYVDPEIRSINAEANIKVILSILLPTSFPVKNNIYETFSGNIKGLTVSSDFKSDSSIFGLLFSDEDNKYGYVNIDGKTWTVVKINLINDLINDKTFRPLLQSGIIFKSWKQQKIRDYKNDADKLEKDLSVLIKEDLPNIKKLLTRDASKGDDEQREEFKIRQQLSRGAQNAAGVIVPTRLLIPFIDELFKTTDEVNIIDSFSKMEDLRLRSGTERKDTYIPLSIARMKGFTELLKKSNEFIFKKELIIQLNSLKKVYEIIKNKKQDKVEDRILREILNNPQLKAFLDEVLKYRSPNRSYSNDKLVNILEEIDIDIDRFLNFIDYVSKINIENEKPKQELLSDDSMTDILKTGIMTVSDKIKTDDDKDIFGLNVNYYYDCLMNLQLIDGIVNDDNIDDVKCPYKQEMLNIMYSNLKYADQKNPMLFYIGSKPFDMATTKKGGRISKKTKTNKRKTQKGGYKGRPSSVRKTIRSTNTAKRGEKKSKNMRLSRFQTI